MHREQSGNPFGEDEQQLDPRGFSVTLDRDTLYSSWFQLADAGNFASSCLTSAPTHCCRHSPASTVGLPTHVRLQTVSFTLELLVLSDHDNKLTGPDAVKFFERSQLPRPLLAKVWALADSARKGYLDPSTFAKVIFEAVGTCPTSSRPFAQQQHACLFDSMVSAAHSVCTTCLLVTQVRTDTGQ